MPKKIIMIASLLLLLVVTSGCSLFGSTPSAPSTPSVTTFNFDIVTPSGTSMSWLIFYPQTQTEGWYDYNFLVSPAGLTNSVSTSTVTGLNKRSLNAATLTSSGSNRADLLLRQSEQELANLRSNFAVPPHDLNFSTFTGFTEGQTYQFQKLNFATDQYEQVNAVYHAANSSSHAIFFVDSSITYDCSAMITELITTFEAKYTTLTDAFGTPYNVDHGSAGTGDGKTIFLLTPLQRDNYATIYGYFWGGNEFDPSADPAVQFSNYTDMVYLNSELWNYDATGLKGTMAHEYQHLLFFSERIRAGGNLNDIWLNEGFSTLAEDLVGGGFLAGAMVSNTHVNDWLWNYSYWSLTNWGGTNESYGGSYLFARYLFDHYGISGTLSISRNKSGGVTAVANATGLPFATVFRNFASSIPYAVYPLVTPPSDPLIGFTCGITLSKEGFNCYYPPVGAAYEASNVLRPWGVEYVGLSGGAPGTQVHVTLTAPGAGNYGALTLEGFMP